MNGSLRGAPEFPRLAPEQVRDLAYGIMTPRQRQRFEQEKDLDFSYSVPDLARFRVNVLCQRGTLAMVIRQIPDQIPTMEQLQLPAVCGDMAMRPRGLVLVTGPTGCGKSTTLASMIDHINTHQEGHIITMEDPLEFIHSDKSCYVTQRQIGDDSATFSQALRRALRQDPDIILVGEMRDTETIQMAITAAETGHLVLATLHTVGATATIDRIIEAFPTDAQQQAKIGLSSTLQGVISQVLLPRKDGGQVAAREILVATDGVRAMIRDGKTAQMLSLQQTGKSVGMITLEQALADLVKQGVVELEVAMSKSNRPEAVAKIVEQRPGAASSGLDVMPHMGSGKKEDRRRA